MFYGENNIWDRNEEGNCTLIITLKMDRISMLELKQCIGCFAGVGFIPQIQINTFQAIKKSVQSGQWVEDLILTV